MKLTTAIASVVFLIAFTSESSAGTLRSPPVWAYEGEQIECTVSNITNAPVEVFVYLYDHDGFRWGGVPWTLEPRNTGSEVLSSPADGGYYYCEVTVPGRRAGGAIRFTLAVFGLDGSYRVAIGRP